MDDDELSAALAMLDAPELSRQDCFPVGTRVHAQRVKDSLKKQHRRAASVFIRSENAVQLAQVLPDAEDDWLHAIIPGDFTFCDLLPATARRFGCPRRIDITTLSLSEGNVHTLLGLLGKPEQPSISLLLSHYFQASNRDIFRAVETMLAGHPRFRLAVARQHTKILLLEWPERALVIEGSANLRSAGCIEQVTARASRDLLTFHREWIDQLHATYTNGTQR